MLGGYSEKERYFKCEQNPRGNRVKALVEECHFIGCDWSIGLME